MAAQADQGRDGLGSGDDRPLPPPVDQVQLYCSGCGRRHGLGWCSHAMRLTQEHLERRGAAFNWR